MSLLRTSILPIHIHPTRANPRSNGTNARKYFLVRARSVRAMGKFSVPKLESQIGEPQAATWRHIARCFCYHGPSSIMSSLPTTDKAQQLDSKHGVVRYARKRAPVGDPVEQNKHLSARVLRTTPQTPSASDGQQNQPIRYLLVAATQKGKLLPCHGQLLCQTSDARRAELHK